MEWSANRKGETKKKKHAKINPLTEELICSFSQYGARYYDPRTSVWQSPDPILDQYMNGSGNSGGVFNPGNLYLFTYTANNPVNLIDPDGLETTGEFLNRWAKDTVYRDVSNNRSGVQGATATFVATTWT